MFVQMKENNDQLEWPGSFRRGTTGRARWKTCDGVDGHDNFGYWEQHNRRCRRQELQSHDNTVRSLR